MMQNINNKKPYVCEIDYSKGWEIETQKTSIAVK